MKTCNKCKCDKRIDEFPRSATSKDGHRAICRACRNEQRLGWKKAKALQDKIQALQEVAAKDHAVEMNVAAPRTYVTFDPLVPSDRDFYRNDGLKHIPSRGL